MLSAKTCFVLTCSLLLLIDFALSTDCALHAPSPSLKKDRIRKTIWPGSVQSSDKTTFSLTMPFRYSPRGVDINLTPIPEYKESDESGDNILFRSVIDNFHVDSEMFFPCSLSDDIRQPYAFVSFCKTLATSDEEESRRILKDRSSRYKQVDPSKFKTIKQITRVAVDRRTTPSNTADTCTFAFANSSLPVIEGKRIVKKETTRSYDHSGGFPGWDSDGEASEYEYVSDTYELSDFNSDSDTPVEHVSEEDNISESGYFLHDVDANSTKIYKPIDIQSNQPRTQYDEELIFAMSDYDSEFEDLKDLSNLNGNEEIITLADGTKIYKPVEFPSNRYIEGEFGIDSDSDFGSSAKKECFSLSF